MDNLDKRVEELEIETPEENTERRITELENTIELLVSLIKSIQEIQGRQMDREKERLQRMI